MTSPGTITTKKNDAINGPVWAGTSYDHNATLNGTLTIAPVTGWPYSKPVENIFRMSGRRSSPYSNSTINISTSGQSGPLYAYTSSNPTRTYTLTGAGSMTGSIYIDGSLSLDNSSNIHL